MEGNDYNYSAETNMITFTNYDKGDVRHHILSKQMSTAKRQRNHGNIQQQIDNIKETVSVH